MAKQKKDKPAQEPEDKPEIGELGEPGDGSQDEIDGGEDPELDGEYDGNDGPPSEPPPARARKFAGTGHKAPNGRYIPSAEEYAEAGYSAESYPQFAANLAAQPPEEPPPQLERRVPRLPARAIMKAEQGPSGPKQLFPTVRFIATIHGKRSEAVPGTPLAHDALPKHELDHARAQGWLEED